MSRFLFATLGYHPHPVGGAWRYAAELSRRLAARRHDVTVVCGNPENNLPPREVREGVTLLRFPNQHGHFFLNWRRENAAARRLIGSVETTSPPPSLLGLHQAFLGPAVAGARPPRVMIFQGPWAEEYLFSRRTRPRSAPRQMFERVIAGRLRAVERDAVRGAREIVVLSRHMQETLRRLHGPELPPVRLVSGGVDLEKFTPLPDRETVRQRLGVPEQSFLLLSSRRLDPRMGLDVLLRALAVVAARHPQARLWLTGDGPDAARLRALVDELRLTDRVRFLGSVSDEELIALFNAADCAVVPSLDLEGFGLVTAEVLACGTPVLGSRAGATPELLESLDVDLLFEPGSVEALAARLEAILCGTQVLPDRNRCRTYAEEHFPWDATVQAFEAMAGAFAADGGAP
jgi:glycosyltransferase involved in cell wall biosynthesis